MWQKTMLLCLGALTMTSPAGGPRLRLPQPRYERKDSDPAWLGRVVQFHGHLGPSVVAGARLGMAALAAVDAKGYFDVEVTCEGPFAKPPQSCFLDGLQVATGATMGKRTLHWVQSERIVVRVKNTDSGKTAELRPSRRLSELLQSLQPLAKVQPGQTTDEHAQGNHEAQRIEVIAREIAAMTDAEILAVTLPGLE